MTAKSFKTKSHFLCMLFEVLTKCSTLREIGKNIVFWAASSLIAV
ncbi:DUF4372 domain-containing protein [Dyadobacter jejuensis]